MKLDPIPAQPVFATDRLDLRPLRRSDQGLLEMYTGDLRVAGNTTSIPHPLPPGATEAFIQKSLAEDRLEDVWVMDGTKSGLAELLGVIGLERMENGQCEIGYWVAPAFWNTGFASEAVRRLVEANPLDSRTMFASVFQTNPVSARVLTNAGFEYLGDAEAFSVALNAKVKTWTYLRKMD